MKKGTEIELTARFPPIQLGFSTGFDWVKLLFFRVDIRFLYTKKKKSERESLQHCLLVILISREEYRELLEIPTIFLVWKWNYLFNHSKYFLSNYSYTNEQQHSLINHSLDSHSSLYYISLITMARRMKVGLVGFGLMVCLYFFLIMIANSLFVRNRTLIVPFAIIRIRLLLPRCLVVWERKKILKGILPAIGKEQRRK